MKTASCAFLFLLFAAHTTGTLEEQLALPLSMFRDGEFPEVGYALFVLLAVIAAIMTRASIRVRRELEAAVFCVACFLFAVVAVTPSLGPFHILSSLVLLVLLYSYFALLLYHSRSVWLYVYIPAPPALLVATGFHSYGIWQKCFIVYLLVVINIHYLLVTRFRTDSASARGPQGSRTAPVSKRRVVYTLQPGKAWARRRVRPAESSLHG